MAHDDDAHGADLAIRFARVLKRMEATHPTTAGMITGLAMVTPGIFDDAWLVDMVPRLEREWPEKGGQ